MAPKRPENGLSLVEILIALAIFLVGVLAVLRVFPTGLGALTRAGDRQTAIRLAENKMSELQTAEERLPDYILPAGRPTDTRADVAGDRNSGFGFLRVMDTTADYRPYDLDLPYLDANDPGLLHRLLAGDRLVVGERVRVGRRSVSSGGSMVGVARPYHTVFGPIDDAPVASSGDPLVADLAVFRIFQRVSPLELRRTTVGASGSERYVDRPAFAVVDGGRDDFTGAPLPDKILLELDGSDRQFMIRCAYRDQYGNIKWVQIAPYYLTATDADPLVPGRAYPSEVRYEEIELRLGDSPETPLTDVLRESVQVRQVLNREDGTDDDGDGILPDRFQFQDYDFSGGGVPCFDHGLLYFSPGLAGEELSLEYVVDDWRNLAEHVDLRTDNTGAITNLVPIPGDPTPRAIQLQAKNLDESFVPRAVVVATGQMLGIDAAAWAADPGLARSGQVPLAAGTALDALAGPREVVVFYRQFGNWLAAPSLAPTAYLLAQDAAGMTSTGDAVDYPVRNLVVETATLTSTTPAGTFTELRFRPSEAGRTVAVTYEVDNAGQRELVVGEIHVVPTQPNRDSGTSTPARPDRCAVVLRRPGVALDTNTPPRPLIWSVEGRSMQVRVAFDDDTAGVEAAPVRTAPAAGVEYFAAEKLVELATYVRRKR